MTDERLFFEDTFAERLLSYAVAGAPRIDRQAVAQAVAAGVAARQRRPRRVLPFRVGQSRFAQVALVALVLLVTVTGLTLLSAGRKPFDPSGGTFRPTPSPSPSPTPPTVSPGFIAFAADASAGEFLTNPVGYSIVETHPQPMDIYVTRAGEGTRRIIATDAHERCPVFSPDGQRLAYLEVPTPDDRPAPFLVVVPIDAAGAPGPPELRLQLPPDEIYRVRLSTGPPCPRWSPDGSQIAYLAYPLTSVLGKTQDLAELRVATLDGRERVLNSDKLAYLGGQFAWSFAGDAIAYSAADGIWTVRLDGSPPSLLWPTDEGTPISVSSWSTRGELAVTVRTEVPVEGGSREVSTVYVVDVATGSARRLEEIRGYTDGPMWSPDGAQLEFINHDGDILLYSHDGPTEVVSPQLVDGHEVAFAGVSWSPEGQRLLARARVSGVGLALVSLLPDGTSGVVLTPGTWAMDWINAGDVSWQPSPH